MNRSYSLRGRDNFRRLARQGYRWSHDLVRIRYLLEPVNPPKLAVSVSRACGNAVRRNRIRRLWAEALRLNQASLPDGQYQLYPNPGRVTVFQARSILAEFLQTLEQAG